MKHQASEIRVMSVLEAGILELYHGQCVNVCLTSNPFND
jgi:hypothetical protein